MKTGDIPDDSDLAKELRKKNLLYELNYETKIFRIILETNSS